MLVDPSVLVVLMVNQFLSDRWKGGFGIGLMTKRHVSYGIVMYWPKPGPRQPRYQLARTVAPPVLPGLRSCLLSVRRCLSVFISNERQRSAEAWNSPHAVNQIRDPGRPP